MYQVVYTSNTFDEDIQTLYRHTLHLRPVVILSVCQNPQNLSLVGTVNVHRCFTAGYL